MNLDGQTLSQLIVRLATMAGQDYAGRQEVAGELMLRLEADAQALADVRTLDAAATPKSFWRTTPALNCWECCRMVWVDSGWRSAEELFDGPTPEAARAAAAKWVREQR